MAPIAFDDFNLFQDDVRRLSFFNKKKLARCLGVKVFVGGDWPYNVASVGEMAY